MIKINGDIVQFESFPNGETRVNGRQLAILTSMQPRHSITFKYENDGDLLRLMFIKSHLDSKSVEARLLIAYMPYSRMDRVEGDSVFTLKYVANWINAMNFKDVIVIEPHSDVTLALLDRSEAWYPTYDLFNDALNVVRFDAELDYLFFPDQGAQKRYGKRWAACQQLVGFKERNFNTGEIDKLQLVGSVERRGFKAIIVDDLCSYGNTFIRSANALREAGASHVYLVVTHAENAIFKGQLFTGDYVDKVFTTNTLLTEEVPERWANKISVKEIV